MVDQPFGRSRRNLSNDRLRDEAKTIRRETATLTEIDRAEPHWADRDGFTMGKGHAALGLHPPRSATPAA